MKIERRWMTISEASSYINVHKMTAYVWASKGLLPVAKIGGCLRVDKLKLDELLDASIENRRRCDLEDYL